MLEFLLKKLQNKTNYQIIYFMKTKKIVWALLCLAFPLLGKAQVAIGTNRPNASAELMLESNSRGFIMPRIALESLQDTRSIKAGNIESLILYNTTSNSQLSPGYYYWANAKWNRIAIIEDIPEMVIKELEKVFSSTSVKELLTELIQKTSGNVWFKDNTLFYKDQQGIQREIKLQQDLTILSYDSTSGILEFLDENQKTTSIDLKQVVEAFQGVSVLKVDYQDGLLYFENQDKEVSIIDLKRIVLENQKNTSFENKQNGVYTFTNEASQTTTLDIISDIQKAIEDKTPSSFHTALNAKIAEQQKLTSLELDQANKRLIYNDEHNKVNYLDLNPLLKANYQAIIFDTIASKHIEINQRFEDNTKVYSLKVPIATNQSLGVIKPGKGLQLDKDGVLQVDPNMTPTGQSLHSGKGILITNGEGAVLKEATIELDPSQLSLGELSGILGLDQLTNGNVGEVLSVNKDGEVEWAKQVVDLQNSLTLVGSKLVSNVQGVDASVDLTNSISTDMLRDFEVTRFKINSDIAGPGLIKNPDTGVLEVDFDLLAFKQPKGSISTKTLTVFGDSGALLKDIEINIKHGAANQILVTNNFGTGVEWKDINILKPNLFTSLILEEESLIFRIDEQKSTLSLNQAISNQMLKDQSVSVNKLDSNFIGEGLKKNITSNSIEVDIDKISQKLSIGNIHSKSLEVKKSNALDSKDLLVEIKPGKANQVLVTSSDESGVEWVNANTLICKDTFSSSTTIKADTTAEDKQDDSIVLKNTNGLPGNSIFIFQHSFSVLPTQQVQELNLYALYQDSFGAPLIQSNPQDTLQKLKPSDIDYFVTKMDQDHLEIVSLSKQGVLRFKIKDSSKTSSVSSLNLILRLK